MEKQYEITCPNCGQKLLITISDANPEFIGVSFFDISDNSEATYLARKLGYEFGSESVVKNDGK